MKRNDVGFRMIMSGKFKKVCEFYYEIENKSQLEYICYGFGALLSGDQDTFDLFLSTKPDPNWQCYTDLYKGAWLYNSGSAEGADLMVSSAEDVTARGYVFEDQRCSWLRGVSSFRPQQALQGQAPIDKGFSFVHGAPDTGSAFLASANSDYFRAFGQTLFKTFMEEYSKNMENKYSLIVNIINPEDDINQFIDKNADTLRRHGIFMSRSHGPDNKWYYTCSRYLIAESILSAQPIDLFIMDFDAEFRDGVDALLSELKNHDMAFKEKGNCFPWQRIQANRVWVKGNDSGRAFIGDLCAYIRSVYRDDVDQWFIDQNALEYARRHLMRPDAAFNLNEVPHLRDVINAPPGAKKKAIIGKSKFPFEV